MPIAPSSVFFGDVNVDPSSWAHVMEKNYPCQPTDQRDIQDDKIVCTPKPGMERFRRMIENDQKRYKAEDIIGNLLDNAQDLVDLKQNVNKFFDEENPDEEVYKKILTDIDALNVEFLKS